MLVVQLSDPHIAPAGVSPGAGVDSYASLARALARVHVLDPRPAGIVVSGDLVERGTREEYARLSALLAPVALPVWLMTGNHDDRDELAGAFPELARHRGAFGLQYVVDLGEARLVLLDSLVEGTAGGALDDLRLAWLDERLAEDDRPAIVFVHHPPVSTGLAHVDRSALANADALADVVSPRHVARVASGHFRRALSVGFAGTTLSVRRS